MPSQAEGGIEYSTATRLLGIVLPAQQRPIDAVIARLERPDGREWLEEAFASPPICALPDPGVLVRGGLAHPKLEEIRAEATTLAAGAGETRLEGILAYFLVCAAGLLHLRLKMTSRSEEALSSALLDLATAMPAPWSDFLARAASIREK